MNDTIENAIINYLREQEEETYVEFQHCGLNSDVSGIAQDIAMSCSSDDEAWAEVDKLDPVDREAIYDRGCFIERTCGAK